MSDVLAIDIGGTKVALAIFDEDGNVTEREVFPTPKLPPERAVAEILDHATALAGGRIGSCGIALPAIVEDGRLTWAASSIEGWDGLPLAEHGEAVLGVPCQVEFDGYAAALGEFWRGEGRGYTDVATVIVGTGVGAGFVHDGRLYRGRTGVAGAIGWFRYPSGDDLAPRLDDFASGRAILASARTLNPAGTYTDTAAVFRASVAGDPSASAVVRSATRALTAAVGAIVAMLAPEVIVLGGSVGARNEVVEAVRLGLAAATQPFAARSVQVRASSLGSFSSLYGAAYLAVSLVHGKESW